MAGNYDNDSAEVERARARAKLLELEADSDQAPAESFVPYNAEYMGKHRFWTPSGVRGNAAKTKAAKDFVASQAAIQKRQAAAAYDADHAAWSALPTSEQMGSFDNWVNNVYSDRTKAEAKRMSKDGVKYSGREVAGPIKSVIRSARSFGLGRNAHAGGGAADFYHGGGLMIPQTILHALHSATGGDSWREGAIARYMEMRSPTRDMTTKETFKGVRQAFSGENIGPTLRSMLDPSDADLTIAGLIPIGGEAGLGTKLALAAAKQGGKIAAKTGANFLTKAAIDGAKAGTGAAKVTGNVLGKPLANVATGAIAGGAMNAAVDENQDMTNAFTAGVVPGALMGGASEFGGKRLAKYFSAPKKEFAPELFPWEHDLNQIHERRADLVGGTRGSVPLEINDLLGSPLVAKALEKTNTDLGVQDLLNKYGKVIAPNMPEGLTPAEQHSKVRAAYQNAKAAKAASDAAAAPPPADKPLTPSQKAAHEAKLAEAVAVHSISANPSDAVLAKMTDSQLRNAVKSGILLKSAGQDVAGLHDFGTFEDAVRLRDEAKARIGEPAAEAKVAVETEKAKKDVDAALNAFAMAPHLGESFVHTPDRVKAIRKGLISDDGRLVSRLAQEGYSPSDVTALMDLAANTDPMAEAAMGGILNRDPLWAKPATDALKARNENYRTNNNNDAAAAISGELNARDAADAQNARLDLEAQTTLQGRTDDLLRSEADRVAAEEPAAMRTAEQDLGDNEKARIESQTQHHVAHSISYMSEKGIASFMSKRIVENPELAKSIWNDPKKLMDAQAAANKHNPLRAEAQKRLDANLATVAADVKKIRKLPKGFM